jgi:tetraprenyl-beta-curcumene synthase
MGDLNFVYYYHDLKNCEDRLSFFINRSTDICKAQKYPDFHLTIIKGLLAMYLSDPKAYSDQYNSVRVKLLKKGGSKTSLYHKLCRTLRGVKVI